MTRAAVYLRISQDKTGEQAGVTRQREDCLEQAKTLGWDVAEEYVDNDRSAYKKRPEYERMLIDIDAGNVDAIIAWHPDRLYRLVKDLGELVDVCKRNNTQIVTVKAGAVDLTTPTGRLVAGLLAQVATYEGEAKSDRWRRSWRQGREQGKWAGSGTRLFGYTRDGHVIPDEAKIAHEMADRIVNGHTILSIARWLADEGIPGTRGGAWTPIAVKQYLRRPILAGYAVLNGQIVGDGDWEPVIPRDLWEECRAILGTKTRNPAPRVALLNGLVFCSQCDTRLITSSQNHTRTYRCSNRPGIDGCGRCSVNAEPVEEIVEEYARERLADPRVRKHIAELRAEPGNASAEVSELELRIAELERTLDQPGVPVNTILKAIDRAKVRQEELLSQLAARNLEPIPTDDSKWPTDLRRRRRLIELVVAKVVINPATRPSRLGFDENRVVVVPR